MRGEMKEGESSGGERWERSDEAGKRQGSGRNYMYMYMYVVYATAVKTDEEKCLLAKTNRFMQMFCKVV